MKKRTIIIVLSFILVLFAANFAFSQDVEKSALPPDNGWTLVEPITVQIYRQQDINQVWIEKYYYKKSKEIPNMEICIVGHYVNKGKLHKIWATYYKISMNNLRTESYNVWFLPKGGLYKLKADEGIYSTISNNPYKIFGVSPKEKRKDKRHLFYINDIRQKYNTEEKMPLGTEVVIFRDLNGNEIGKTANLIDFTKKGYWLYDKDGNFIKEAKTLPRGYVEWNWKTEDFPGQKYGIPALNPTFILDDGSLITGQECYWRIADYKLQKEMIKKNNEEMNLRIEKIKEYWKQKQNTN